MRFRITKSSSNTDPFGNPMEKPHEKAEGVLLIAKHEGIPVGWWRKEPQKAEIHEAQWKSRGANHRIENGVEVRDLETTVYFIEVESLQNLLDMFPDTPVIISGPDGYDYCQAGKLSGLFVPYKDYVGNLEIYDSYRE